MVDKWAKLVDSQAKSSTASLGMVIQGANAEVASGMELLGKGKGYLEVALEHAESSRTELLDETTRLRRLILVSANRLQSMMHEIRILALVKSEEASFFHCSSIEIDLICNSLFPLIMMHCSRLPQLMRQMIKFFLSLHPQTMLFPYYRNTSRIGQMPPRLQPMDNRWK